MKTNPTTKLLKMALVLAMAFSLTNCSKDDDTPAPVANPEVNLLSAY